MPLIIDGYNLLHASGILGRGIGPGGLERSRRALLNFLVESLAERELDATVVVFDAPVEAPLRTRQTEHRGLAVQFATAGDSADDLIERLIAEHAAPRRLTVVSSDHRLHRAARRRRATAIDSDLWFAQLVRARRDRTAAGPPAAEKPDDRLSAVEIKFWLEQFGLANSTAEEGDAPGGPRARAGADNPAPDRADGYNAPPNTRTSDFGKGVYDSRDDDERCDGTPLDPFPPGYAEDIGPDDI